jgi:hypothetical protein
VRREVERGVHEREMGERLREVPQQSAGVRVVLLGHQPEVVAEVDEPAEQLVRLVVAPEQLVAVAEPERAREEDALARRQPVDARLVRAVAEDKAVLKQLPFHRLDGAPDALVGGGEEADERQEEKARVELL